MQPVPLQVIESGCWALVEKGLILEVEDHHPHHVVLPAWGGVVGEETARVPDLVQVWGQVLVEAD